MHCILSGKTKPFQMRPLTFLATICLFLILFATGSHFASCTKEVTVQDFNIMCLTRIVMHTGQNISVAAMEAVVLL